MRRFFLSRLPWTLGFFLFLSCSEDTPPGGKNLQSGEPVTDPLSAKPEANRTAREAEKEEDEPVDPLGLDIAELS